MSDGEVDLIKTVAERMPAAQGWTHRRPRVDRVLWTSLAISVAVGGGITAALAQGHSISWALAVAAALPFLLAAYTLTLYLQTARGEQIDVFKSVTELVTSVGDAASKVLGKGN